MLCPNEDQKVALKSIASNTKAIEFLRESRADCNEALEICKDEVSFRWLQGRAQALGELVSLIEGMTKPNVAPSGGANITTPGHRPSWP